MDPDDATTLRSAVYAYTNALRTEHPEAAPEIRHCHEAIETLLEWTMRAQGKADTHEKRPLSRRDRALLRAAETLFVLQVDDEATDAERALEQAKLEAIRKRLGHQ
jgi:hypothetical protein